jgi:hypothetical protein
MCKIVCISMCPIRFSRSHLCQIHLFAEFQIRIFKISPRWPAFYSIIRTPGKALKLNSNLLTTAILIGIIFEVCFHQLVEIGKYFIQ